MFCTLKYINQRTINIIYKNNMYLFPKTTYQADFCTK